MLSRFTSSALLASALGLGAGPAAAALVTFDDLSTGVYDAGTDFSGLTFDSAIQIGDSTLPPPGFDFLAGPGMSGNIARQFTPPFGAERGGSINGFFSSSVSGVSLVAGDVGFDVDNVTLNGFDVDMNLVDSASFSSAASQSIAISGPGIVSFALLITDNNASGSSGFDNIAFEFESVAVPAPGALGLLALGLFGLGQARLRRPLG